MLRWNVCLKVGTEREAARLRSVVKYLTKIWHKWTFPRIMPMKLQKPARQEQKEINKEEGSSYGECIYTYS